MIQTLLFDFGNVIAFFDHARAIRRLLPYTDRTAEQLRQLIYFNDLDIRYERGEVTTEDVFAVAQDVAGLRCTFDQFVAAFCDIFWSNPPMDDLIPRLKQAGYRLVLASNTNAAHYERYREQFRATLSHFDSIVVSHEAGARKPHAQFFEYAHARTCCVKSECLFVDDLAENIAAAREFGWRAAQYTKFDELVPELESFNVRAA